MPQPRVRWMIRRDTPSVLAVEQEFGGWTADQLLAVLRERNRVGLVADVPAWPGKYGVGGFLIYELGEDRITILRLAVLACYRRRHVGRALVQTVTDKLSYQRRNRAVADVHEANLPMQLFLRACGFRAEPPVLRNYFEDQASAYRMVHRVEAPGTSDGKD